MIMTVEHVMQTVISTVIQTVIRRRGMLLRYFYNYIPYEADETYDDDSNNTYIQTWCLLLL